LKLVVMGTGPFAVPMFEALRRSPHRVLAVVTRPAHAAPGRRPPKNPMREAAQAAGSPVLDPERVNDDESVAAIEKLEADLFVVCDYGQILSPRLLAAAPLGGINLHGSLLPRHRGAAPVQWAILEGDPITGVSVIHMTPALDAGAVMRKPGEPLVVGIPQDASHATKAPRLTKADGVVDWSQPAHRLERMRRALEPWPRTAAFLHRDGAAPLRLVLEDVAVVDSRAAATVATGTILAADDEGIVVACGAGTALSIRRLLPEGRRSMTAAEFLRGHPILPGMRFA
jgi:methionyl-tRNA formyltransferase